jgi:uncharacterized membrane protein YgdD (TMEM256/DUF423 family)
MLIAALTTAPQAGVALLLGWIVFTAAAWRAALTAHQRIAAAGSRDIDEWSPIVLAAGVTLALSTLMVVKAGALQTSAEILMAWACVTLLLRMWLDARLLPAPKRRRALPPMDDAIGGSRSGW